MVVAHSISLTPAVLVPFPVSSPSYRGGGMTGETGTYPKSLETGKPGKTRQIKLQPRIMSWKINHKLRNKEWRPARSDGGSTTRFRWLVINFLFTNHL
jgi:hypothetical protein